MLRHRLLEYGLVRGQQFREMTPGRWVREHGQYALVQGISSNQRPVEVDTNRKQFSIVVAKRRLADAGREENVASEIARRWMAALRCDRICYVQQGHHLCSVRLLMLVQSAEVQ
jgi:hypothetical protein